MFRRFFHKHRPVFAVFGLLLVYKAVYYTLAYFGYYFTYRVEVFDAARLIGDVACQWDCRHYLSIAQDGYTATNAAFYPLFPWLLAIAGRLIGYPWAEFAIANASLFFALLGLYKLAKLDETEEASWRAVLYLLVMPTALFLSAVYAEPVFLALAVWTFYAARKGDWQRAGILGLLSGLARIEGQAVMIFLIVEYLAQKKFRWREARPDLLYCLAPLAGLAVYGLFLWKTFGDPLLFIHAQAVWGKRFAWPWQTFWDYWVGLFLLYDPVSLKWYIPRFFDFLAFFSSLLLGLIIWAKLHISYGAYVLAAVLMVSFTAELTSTNRHQLLYFPIFIMFGRWGKNRLVDFALIAGGSGLLAINLYRWVYGAWVG